MSASFTLELVGGANQSLADWGLDSLTREISSLAADLLRVRAPGRAVDAARLFNYGDEIKLHQITAGPVDTVIFRGHCRQPSDLGSGRAEDHVYEFRGLWDLLERTTYQQLWTISDGFGGTTTAYRPRVHLFSNLDGSYVTIADQITAILNYALSCTGVTGQFLVGTIEPAINAPPREAVDVSCAEAIRQCLRLAPDTVGWFDYSTNPPTFHCRQHANLAAVSVARNRQQEVASVVIFYEIGDVSYPTLSKLSVDAAPGGSTGRELGALVATIGLQGGSSGNQLRQDCITNDGTTGNAGANTGTPAQKQAWWAARIPALNKALADEIIKRPSDDQFGFDLSSISIKRLNVDGSVVGTLDLGDYPWELIAGAITPWMQESPHDVLVTRARATASIAYYVYEAGAGKRHVETNVPISVEFIATDAATKEEATPYTKSTGGSVSETPPTGLADYLLTALNRAQYSGDISFTSAEVGDVAIAVGNKLNLTGLRSEWTTMNALVIRVVEDFDRGLLRVTFGAPPQLGLGDLVELLQSSRWRREPNGLARKNGTTPSATSKVQLANWTPQTKGSYGKGEGGHQKFVDPDADANVITLAPEGKQIKMVDGDKTVDIQLAHLDTGQTAQFRDVTLCVDGAQKVAKVLMTEPVDP
jgi:hypothetical protein